MNIDYLLDNINEDGVKGSMKFGTIDLDIGKEKDTLHHKAKDTTKVPSGIKDFKEFCKKIKNPFMSMKWFIKNKIKWTPNGGSNDHPFQWPDWLIKQRMGNCFDQTIFMHYYCQNKRIEHKMFLITWIADNGQGSGHAVPVFKKGNYCYIWFYLRPGIGHVAGPFRDWDECQKMMNQYFLFYMNRCFGSPCDVYSSYLDEHDMKEFDQYYGDRKILQSEYIIEGLGKHMRSSHMLKIKANGFLFPNPALPIYDAIVYAYKMLLFSNKIVPLWNDEDLKEDKTKKKGIKEEVEYDLQMIDEAKGYNIYTKQYRNFKEFCKEMPTVQDMLNWYKTNKINGKTIKNGSEGPFIWPDEILEKKKAICFDTALFVYYYCKSKNITSTILRVGGYYRGNAGELQVAGHGVGVCKLNDSWFVFDYFGSEPELASMFGPYPTIEELVKAYKKRFRSLLEYREIKLEGGIASYIFTKEDLAKFDKIYGLKIGRDAFVFSIKGIYNARDRECLKSKNYNLLDVIIYQANVFRKLKDVFVDRAVWEDHRMLLEAKYYNSPESFNDELCKYDYGYMIKDKKITNEMIEEDNFKHYTLLGNDKFEKEKIGTCWDYTLYEAKIFDEQFNYDYKLWYIQENRGDNHTWLSYKDGSIIKAFEASWGNYQGIHKFPSEKDMVNYYIKACIQEWNMEEDMEGLGKGIFVTIFDNFDPKGMKPEEFMQKTIHGNFYTGSAKIHKNWLNKIDRKCKGV